MKSIARVLSIAVIILGNIVLFASVWNNAIVPSAVFVIIIFAWAVLCATLLRRE